MGSDRHPKPMRFIDHDLSHIEGHKLIELYDVAVELLFPLHRTARLIWRHDGDVAARSPRAERIMFTKRTANPAPSHPYSWTADFAEIGALLLGAAPWAVLVELDLGAGGDAQMQIEFAVEILQVAVAVDE